MNEPIAIWMRIEWRKWKDLVGEAGFIDAEIGILERNHGTDLSELDAQMISFSPKIIFGFAAQIVHSTVAQLDLRSILNMNFDRFFSYIL